jgi:GTPase SAR1 family protein
MYLYSQFFILGDLFVLVFNIDDLESYNQIKQLQDLILELKKTKQKDSKKKIPILILANKKDLMLQKRTAVRSNDSSENHHMNPSAFKSSLYFEISCKQSLGIENAFEKLFLQANLPIEMVIF